MNYPELMIRNQYVSHAEQSIEEALILKSMPCTDIYRQSINHLRCAVVRYTRQSRAWYSCHVQTETSP